MQHREVRDDAGRWYEMTIRPYKTQENKIGGTVVTLVDIDELKRGELAIIGARDYADSIVETAPTPILVLDPEFRVRTANRTFCQKYEIDPVEARKQHVFSLGEGAWNFPRLHELSTQVRDRGRGFDKVEVRLELPRVGGRTILLTGRAMGPVHDGKPEFILLAIEDITERRRGEAMQDVQHKSIRDSGGRRESERSDQQVAARSSLTRSNLNSAMSGCRMIRTVGSSARIITRGV